MIKRCRSYTTQTVRIVPVKYIFFQDSAKYTRAFYEHAYIIIPKNIQFVSRRQGSTGSGEESLVVVYHYQITNEIHIKPENISKDRIFGTANGIPAVACLKAMTTSRHVPSNRKAPKKSIFLSVPDEKLCQNRFVTSDVKSSVCNYLGMTIITKIKAADLIGTLNPDPIISNYTYICLLSAHFKRNTHL